MIVYVDGEQKDFDIRPGSIIRFLLESWFDEWEEYEVVYIARNWEYKHSIFKGHELHNEQGPAAIRTNGDMEWWLNGKKIFVSSQKEFECYMRNKAFW